MNAVFTSYRDAQLAARAAYLAANPPLEPIHFPEIPFSPKSSEEDDTTALFNGHQIQLVTGNDPNVFVNFTQRQNIILFYEKDQTPMGTLFWNTSGTKDKQAGNQLPLHLISDLHVQKGNKVLQSPSLSDVSPDQCFSIQSNRLHQHHSFITKDSHQQHQIVTKHKSSHIIRQINNLSTCAC